MKYFSCFSGIEAASEAWNPLGWEAVGFSEIDPFASAVLAHRHPGVKNYGDISKHEQWNIPGKIDLIIGGSPCQSFSSAGLRKGLEDPRGNLMLTFLGFVKSRKPRWVVWENVPGVLSSGGGRDFATLLQGLEICGYVPGWRVLDAQFFGVAQRRKRVWLVAYLGDGKPVSEVLFKCESLRGNPAEGRKEGQSTSSDAAHGIEGGCVGALDTQCGAGKLTHQTLKAGHVIPTTNCVPFDDVCPTLLARDWKGIDTYSMEQGGKVVAQKAPGSDWPKSMTPYVIPKAAWQTGSNANFGYTIEQAEIVPTLVAHGPDAVGFQTSQLRKQGKIEMKSVAPTLLAEMTGDNGVKVVHVYENHPNDSRVTGPHSVAPTVTSRFGTGGGNVPFALSSKDSNGMLSKNPHAGFAKVSEISKTLDTSVPDPSKNQGGMAIVSALSIRRLTPLECERLQGFSDNYTQIPWKNKGADACPDSRRYKAIGNSMAVPCVRWLGERIEKADKERNWMTR
jgi:DNA (cytosine-5)-methyltransferase 1